MTPSFVAPLMDDVEPSPRRALTLSLPVVQLRPGRRTHLAWLVNEPLQIQRVIVPSAAASNVDVHAIVIEGVSQIAVDQPIPADVFSELAIGLSLDMNIAASGSVVDIVVRNRSPESKPFTLCLIGEAPGFIKLLDAMTPPEDRLYHAWATGRQATYESLHRADDEDCYFNGVEIFVDTFAPTSKLWWVDEDGWKKRPVYTFEKVTAGDKIGGLQVVDNETYEGFT